MGLNEICKAYFGQDSLLDLTYKVQWFDSSSFDETLFLSSSQHPGTGNAWLWSHKEFSGTPTTGSGYVEYIKMSTTSANGENISSFITSADSITFTLNGAQDVNGNILYGPQTWQINSAVIQGDSALIYVNPALSSTAVNSLDDISFDFSFSASGLFSWESTSSGADPYVTKSLGITSSIPQGYFPPVSTFPDEQFFRGWESAVYYLDADGTPIYAQSSSTTLYDPLNNFNTGSKEADNDDYYLTSPGAGYKASSLPWFMNASASQLQITSASTEVGSGLGIYTGSITQSTVEFGLDYTVGGAGSPISSSITVLSSNNTVGPFFTALTGSDTTIGNTPSTVAKPQVQIISSDPSLEWRIGLSGQYISGNSGPSWISTDAPYTLGYHTGSATVTFTVIDGITNPSTPTYKAARKANITINTAQTNQTFSFCVLQVFEAESTTGIGGGGIKP